MANPLTKLWRAIVALFSRTPKPRPLPAGVRDPAPGSRDFLRHPGDDALVNDPRADAWLAHLRASLPFPQPVYGTAEPPSTPREVHERMRALPQQGGVPGRPADWVMEMPCRVRRGAIAPLPAAPLHPAVAGLVAAVKAYELLTVEAAVHGDREAAYQALVANPIGPEMGQVDALLDEMLTINRPYLPQFFGAA